MDTKATTRRQTEYATEAKPKAYAGGIPVFCAHDAIVSLSELKPNPANPNTHPQKQIKALGEIIRAGGWRNPITVSKRSGMIVRGHGRLLAARLEELTEAPVDFQEYASDAEEMADLVADNRLAELSEIDEKQLADLLVRLDTEDVPLVMTGYTVEELGDIVEALGADTDDEDEEDDDADENDEDVIEDPPEKATTQRGDLWIMGKHRLVCGDATNEKDRALLFNGARPEILITDPPYCSGGFQEGGRSAGSIGTDRVDGNMPTIANDTLSTRGYQALMKAVIQDLPILVAYIFTDWRMWCYLFDIVESNGLGVKSMIVWNKKTPGMGVGWRTQHELVMFAHRTKPKFDNHKGYGNVLECSRTGNTLHPTQKPVEIIEKLLDNTAWAKGVADMFGGSGTTLIASENAGQPSFTMELTPEYCDVIVRRYIIHTGRQDVKCIRQGRELGTNEIAGILLGAEGGGEA